MQITIDKCPYERNICLYKTDTLELNPGLTVIIGRNGIGKTTLLKVIESYCNSNNIPVFRYDNYKEGASDAHSKYGFMGDFTSLSSTLFHSEGEQIFLNLGKTIEKIGVFERSNKGKECVVLLDALDSGLDVEGISQLTDLINLVCSSNKQIYFIVTANNYAMVHKNNCLDTQTGEYLKFNKFTEYRNFIQNQYKKEREKQ